MYPLNLWHTSNCSVKFSQIQDRHSWITDVAQFIFTRSQKCSWKLENTHLHNTCTLVLWDKLCHFQPWLFHSQKILRLLGIQETEAFSYWSEQCDMKLLLPAQTLCGQHVVSRLLARSEMLSQCQANTATHTWKPINKWNRKQKMKGKPHDTQILKYPSVPRPRPSSSLTESWLDCPWFFFFSTTCQICISGARPGGIRFKKDSLHSQKLISSSIPALGAPQPAARDRGVSELWPLESSDSLSDEPLHLFGRSAVTPVTVKTF